MQDRPISPAFLSNRGVESATAADSVARLGSWLRASFLLSGERWAYRSSVQVRLRHSTMASPLRVPPSLPLLDSD
jgi:hypothetical protein